MFEEYLSIANWWQQEDHSSHSPLYTLSTDVFKLATSNRVSIFFQTIKKANTEGMQFFAWRQHDDLGCYHIQQSCINSNRQNGSLRFYPPYPDNMEVSLGSDQPYPDNMEVYGPTGPYIKGMW